ncbi:MAG: hypothetical protein HS107_04290 [Thermoflexaceae bacterium]|nr:hypothetical protein [Thermoflexaceae bacterium]
MATELAVRLAQGTPTADTTVVSAYCYGDASSEGVLRLAIAIGANKATRVESDGQMVNDPLATALALSEAMSQEKPDVVLCGERSPDFGSAFVPTAMATALQANIVRNVIAIERCTPDSIVLRQRMPQGAQQVVEASFPTVVAVLESAATPRYPSVRARMSAERFEILVVVPRAGIRGSGLVLSTIKPPRPSRMIGPDPHLSAHERYELMLSAGLRQHTSSQTIKGDLEAVAAELLGVLGK